MLTGTPTELGQYVVGICVEEYRNGVLINTVRRDFQFNVTDCAIVQAIVQSDQINSQGNFILNDCGDYNVQFINNSVGATEYIWNFGDPTTTADVSTAALPTYAYPDTGQYFITLIARNGLCIDTAHIVLNLYPTLTTDFSFVDGCAGLSIPFTDLSATSYGTLAGWTWNFGDGTEGYATAGDTSHFYASGGDYVVTLTTLNSVGCYMSRQHTVHVKANSVANFSTANECLNTPLQFTNASSNAASWQWDFGNPADPNDQSSQASPTYVYTEPGNYTATLIVNSVDGCADTLSQSFVIYPTFVADAGPMG